MLLAVSVTLWLSVVFPLLEVIKNERNKAERRKNKPALFQTPPSSDSLAFTFPPLLFQPLICLTGPDELKTVWLNEDNRVCRTMLSAAGRMWEGV